ncbi:hypothetical protein Tco_0425884 [Tanacetum coccineum]
MPPHSARRTMRYMHHAQLEMLQDKEKGSKRTVEQWLRKERDEERKRRKERKANGLPEFDRCIDGTQVTGDPVRMINNGWAAARLNSTLAGE